MAIDNYQNLRHLASAKLDQIFQMCEEKGCDPQIVEELHHLDGLLKGEISSDAPEISAQFSLYPLREPKLSPTIKIALEKLAGFGLQIIPGSMSTLIIGKEDVLWHALHEVFEAASENVELVLIVTFSNACPKPN